MFPIVKALSSQLPIVKAFSSQENLLTGQYKMQTADMERKKCRQKTAEWVQNADWVQSRDWHKKTFFGKNVIAFSGGLRLGSNCDHTTLHLDIETKHGQMCEKKRTNIFFLWNHMVTWLATPLILIKLSFEIPTTRHTVKFSFITSYLLPWEGVAESDWNGRNV